MAFFLLKIALNVEDFYIFSSCLGKFLTCRTLIRKVTKYTHVPEEKKKGHVLDVLKRLNGKHSSFVIKSVL